MSRTLGWGLCLALVGGVFGCASAPKTSIARAELHEEADQTVATMTAADPGLKPLLDQSAGYIVFPDVKQGGFVVGGAGGKGVLYEHGRRTGFAELSQASFGAQVGGQAFSEIVVIRDQYALNRVKASNIDLGGQASATIVKAGAAAAAPFNQAGLAVFVEPKGGAMLNVSLTGQKVKFTG
jgi:lipid-binding SYLF domain-containing protein